MDSADALRRRAKSMARLQQAAERVTATAGKLARGISAASAAVDQMRASVQQIAAGLPITREVYPYQIAFNVLPQVDSFLPDGYTKEEMKMQNEGRKIMHHAGFRASVTCVRVPVYRSHSVAVTAE